MPLLNRLISSEAVEVRVIDIRFASSNEACNVRALKSKKKRGKCMQI